MQALRSAHLLPPTFFVTRIFKFVKVSLCSFTKNELRVAWIAPGRPVVVIEGFKMPPKMMLGISLREIDMGSIAGY